MLHDIRSMVAQLIPVHFSPQVPHHRVEAILQGTLADNLHFCHAQETWVVVDAGSVAEGLFREARAGSPLFGLNLLVLPVNRGKTGAIRAGLSWVLAESRARYFVTRDCDGDSRIEDLPRLVLLAEAMPAEAPRSVFGCRPSLAKPMTWERLQWEALTNQVFFDLVSYLLAASARTLIKNFWNQPTLDLQSGYRLYDREAATIAARSLTELPDEREIYLLACEVSPFIEITLAGGQIGQVYRSTQVEQPVSSYAALDFARYYGRLLRHYALHYGAPVPLIRQMFDNGLVESDGLQSGLREQLLECRRIIDPDSPELSRPPLL